MESGQTTNSLLKLCQEGENPHEKTLKGLFKRSLDESVDARRAPLSKDIVFHMWP
jgi:hypothetical protein